MKKMSTGQDSTIGNWIAMCKAFFGEDSASVIFLEEKAKEAKNGLEEEVISDEGQLIQVLFQLHSNGKAKKEGEPKTSPKAGTVTEDSVYLHLEAVDKRGTYRFDRKTVEPVLVGIVGPNDWEEFFSRYDDSVVEWLLRTYGGERVYETGHQE